MLHRTETIPVSAGTLPQQPLRSKNATFTSRRNHRKRAEPHDVPTANINGLPHRQPQRTSAAFNAASNGSTPISANSLNRLFNRPLRPWGTFLAMGFALTLIAGTSFLLPPSSLPSLPGQSRSRSVRHHVITSSGGGSPGSMSGSQVRIAVVAPLDEISPLGPDWHAVLPHLAQRLSWQEPELQLRIIDASSIPTTATSKGFSIFEGDDIVMALGITNPSTAEALLAAASAVPTFAALGSVDTLHSAARMAGLPISLTDPVKLEGFSGLLASLQAFLVPGARTAQRRAHALATMQELYTRHTSDDLLFTFLVIVNEAVRPVAAVSNSTKRTDAGLDAVSCMIGNCGKEMFQCFTDATCRTALDCMNACAFNDQVCSYRCIASYESKPLEAFSLCIIQKHNCLGLSAEIPQTPNPAPLTTFQGSPLTHEVAEGLFVGWLKGAKAELKTRPTDLIPSSWRVFAGKNPAYDYFPCQFQLFYPGKAKGSFWYQPVFKVLTIDGHKEWRQRLYRVRRDKTPGTFFLSVLDNGVTSLERWSIVDCDEGLEWGAASNAGMSYTGAVLGSKNGDWPTSPEALSRIEIALDKAGIKMWELSTVNNDECGQAPLNLIGPTAALAAA